MMRVILLLWFFSLGSSPAMPKAITQVDQVIRKAAKLYLFRYASWQVQVWNTAHLEHWAEGGEVVPPWKNITRPPGPFLPLRVVPGQSWNFLVLDAGEKRLWQLDSALQILSSLPLPKEALRGDYEAMRIFWSRDDRFTFVNIAEGRVFQYQEIAGKLVFRQRIQITLSCKDLFQAAWRAGDIGHREYPFICQSRKGLLAYNPFFNQKRAVADSLLKNPAHMDRPVLLSGFKWGEKDRIVFTYVIGDMAFCFQPETSRFYYCPQN